MKTMWSRYVRTLCALVALAAPAASGQLIDSGASKTPAAQSLVQLSASTTQAGDEVSGVAHGVIQGGWHINSARPLEEFSIPTTLTLEGDGVSGLEVTYPAHIERSFDFAGGKLAVYEGTISIPFRAKRSPDAKGPLTVHLRYQACNDSVCLPPTQITAVAGAPGVAGTPPSASGTFVPLSKAPAKGGSLWGGDLGATLESRGLGLTLLVIFVAGIALNLTPCVYPLIPITLAFFSSQSGNRRSQRVLLSLSYVIGIAITYSTLGVVAALSGRLFGNWLQHPAVLGGFAVLMVILASSMFGMWDIRIPHFIADRTGARAGLLGALTMGLLVGVVAAPCVGPFVISLIALVSQSGSAGLGFLLFFCLALGLGLPYLLLGIFSSGLTAMPRSGAWMDHVKKAMGFVLVAMAFYFLRPVIGDTFYRAGVAGSLLVGSGWLLLSGWKNKAKSGTEIRLGFAVLLFAVGVVFAIPPRHTTGLKFSPWSESALAAAKTAGKPVVIDFYADWCLPCKELDEKTFTDPEVLKEGARFVRLKGNLTSADDPLGRTLTQRYAIAGVPTIVFIGADGVERTDLRLSGFEAPEKFLERMRSAK